MLREARRNGGPDLSLVEGEGAGANKNGLHRFGSNQLAWDRLEDIRTLIRVRGGVSPHQSMTTLFMSLNFLLLSGVTNSTQMFYEAAALSNEFGFGAFNRDSELSTLYNKAKDNEAGKTVTFNGREYPPLYTPRNSTLIDMFGITDDEQRQLRTIISKDMAKERDAERNRKKRHESGENKMSRAEYVSINKDKSELAIQMKKEGNFSNRSIAKTLQVPESTVRSWVRKVRP